MSDQPIDTESRRALHELIDLLGEVDRRWASPEWNLHTDEDVFGAHRALMHMLQWGLVGLFERDPAAPRFHRIVDPDRKVLGDNPDAVYFDAPVEADHAYRVTGETRGATYVSITVESGDAWGSMSNQVVGVLNDESFDVDADGRFEILLGGEPRPPQLAGPARALRVDQHPPLLRGRHPRRRRPRPGPRDADPGARLRRQPRHHAAAPPVGRLGGCRHPPGRRPGARAHRGPAPDGQRPDPHVDLAGAQRVPDPGPARRPGPGRLRRRLRHGPVPARPRRGPRHPGPAGPSAATPTCACGTATCRPSTTRPGRSRSTGPRPPPTPTAASPRSSPTPTPASPTGSTPRAVPSASSTGASCSPKAT